MNHKILKINIILMKYYNGEFYYNFNILVYSFSKLLQKALKPPIELQIESS